MHAKSNNYVINNYVMMRLGSPGCEIVSNLLSAMALLKFLVKMNEGSDTLQLPSVSLCTSTLSSS